MGATLGGPLNPFVQPIGLGPSRPLWESQQAVIEQQRLLQQQAQLPSAIAARLLQARPEHAVPRHKHAECAHCGVWGDASTVCEGCHSPIKRRNGREWRCEAL